MELWTDRQAQYILDTQTDTQTDTGSKKDRQTYTGTYNGTRQWRCWGHDVGSVMQSCTHRCATVTASGACHPAKAAAADDADDAEIAEPDYKPSPRRRDEIRL